MQVEPVTLTGNVVELRPLAPEYADGLFGAISDPELWLYLPSRQPQSVAEMEEMIRGATNSLADLPFVIIHRESGRVAGTTRMLEISKNDRGLEIGWTIVGTEFLRTAVNTECKYLLMRHAFETWGCIRVQLKTDLRNERSQRAIERIGGVREGILRKVRVMPDGYLRSSVMYSITDDEWPAVKANLEAKLGLVKA
jgi:RimJ/RimL family protein N-acetyltransferase